MPEINLDAVALEQLHGEQKALLDTIDDLRKHGVGRYVDLPQIIVVGDQSSGKSSVLEAISRVRFPVKDGLCTRFAVELVLRTSSKESIDVQIQPLPLSRINVQTFNKTSLNREELPKIIETAKRTMLVDGAGFSEDVLRVEICGPKVPPLTLVDLPGFYHSENKKQSAAGREVVDRLVERYMAKKNSIILAIVSAQNKLILQKFLSKINHHDRAGARTLGVVTKPDTLKTGSPDEENFIRLVKNLDRSHQLLPGWHVLRNRGEGEDTDTDETRDETERAFFESTSWATVVWKNRGVGALRTRLSSILLNHVKTNLPSLINSIKGNIKERQNQLKRLGEPRSSPRELRAHLDMIASRFQILSLNALEGNYSDEFFGGLYPESSSLDSRIRKLRALVRDLNRVFTYVLVNKGSRRLILPKIPREYAFGENDDSYEPYHSDSDNDDDDDDRDGEENGNENKNQQMKLPPFLQDLASQYRFEDPQKVTSEAIATELEELSSANQGTEFPGISNDRLAVKSFQDQSRPWENIARFHLEQLRETSQSFVHNLLVYITSPDTKTCSAILLDIVDPYFEKQKAILEKKLKELLYHYRGGYPQPLDAEFRTGLARRCRKNLAAETVSELLSTQPDLFTYDARMRLYKDARINHKSEFGVEALINKAETYYEMSLRTFSDNIVILAVENCLIRKLPDIFTTERISQMEDSELEHLAAESNEMRSERSELQREYYGLVKGLEACDKYRERRAMSVSTVLESMVGSTEPLETTSNARDPNPADEAYRGCFPHGYDEIDTPKDGLLCGLHAIVLSFEAQHLSQLPLPTMDELREITRGERFNPIKRETFGRVRTSRNNFRVDELGRVLELWGESQSLDLHLGYVLADDHPYLVFAHNPEAKVIWIHSTSTTGSSENTMDHYTGMRPRTSSDENDQSEDERGTSTETEESPHTKSTKDRKIDTKSRREILFEFNVFHALKETEKETLGSTISVL